MTLKTSLLSRALAGLTLLSCATPDRKDARGTDLDPQAGATRESSAVAPAAPSSDPLFSPAPWTERFATPAVLIADRVHIEGPSGLLEHLAVLADDELFETSVRSTAEGLVQTVRPRPAAQSSGVTVRAHLDAWQLVAFRELTSVERTQDVPIRIVAEGDVTWRDRDGQERTGPSLEIEEHLERRSPDADPRQ